MQIIVHSFNVHRSIIGRIIDKVLGLPGSSTFGDLGNQTVEHILSNPKDSAGQTSKQLLDKVNKDSSISLLQKLMINLDLNINVTQNIITTSMRMAMFSAVANEMSPSYG